MPKFRFNHMELSFAQGNAHPAVPRRGRRVLRRRPRVAHPRHRGRRVSSATCCCPTTASSSCWPRARSRCRRPGTTTSGLLMDTREEVDAVLEECQRFAEKDDRMRIKVYEDLVEPYSDHARVLREVPAADLVRRPVHRADERTRTRAQLAIRLRGYQTMTDDRRAVPSRTAAAGGEVHGDLGRRPRRRATAHLRGSPPGAPAGPRAARRRHAAGSPDLGVRGPEVHAGRDERGGRSPADPEDGAVPLRPDAAELLRRRRPRARHGHQRHLGGGELPVDGHRASAGACSSTPRTPSSVRRASGPGTTGCTRSGTSPHPTRIIPLGIAVLSDPRRRGRRDPPQRRARVHRASPCPSGPHLIGLPDLWQRDHWDPIIQACVDTDTVLSIHVGSSGGAESPASAPRLQLGATLFGQLSLHACAEWLWSEYPVKHPTLKLAMSEGGIGWVAMLIDRLDNIIDRSRLRRRVGHPARPTCCGATSGSAPSTTRRPSTPATRIGVENIMVETDFPHGDGTWPDTQLVIEKLWGHIPDDELRMMCSENAAKLYRHPLPDVGPPADPVVHARAVAVCDASRRMTTTTDAPDDAGRRAGKPSRMAAWRAHSFGPASEQPYRRRTSDWVRLVIGVAILVFAIWHQDDPGTFERNLFTTLNGLPNELESFFRLLYAVGRALGARPRRGRRAGRAAVASRPRPGDRRRRHLGARPAHRRARRREREPHARARRRHPDRRRLASRSPRCGSR